MKQQIFALALVCAILAMCAIFSGCTTLVKDCEQQGQSQYYHCKRIWMPR